MTVDNIITIISVIAAISGIIFGAAAFAREFAEIDRERIRPLAAIASGNATDEDRNRLAGLEAKATALREELAGLEV